MFCRICGKEIPREALYCTGCGAPVGRSVEVPPPKKNNKLVLIVITVLIVAICIAAYAVSVDDEIPSKTYGDITISGGLIDDDVGFTDTGLEYTGEGDAEWKYLDTALPFYEHREGTYVPRGHILVSGDVLEVPEPGVYDVILSVDGVERLQGVMIKDGEICRTYEWSAKIGSNDVKRFTVDFTYTLSEFRTYSESTTERNKSFMNGDSRFVVTDGTMWRFHSCLFEEYRSVFGNDVSVSDQSYADYLLSFVQCAISYPDQISYSNGAYISDRENGNGDMYLRGTSEYWAFPIETIHLGVGDCEDTTFLLVSLYSVAGYDSALVSLPGHMMAAVELESFDLRTSEHKAVLACKRIIGHEYNIYFCETTCDVAVPVGYTPEGLRDTILDEIDTVTFIRSSQGGYA